MDNEKILVTEEVAENVETTTEEVPKVYTEAEFNAKLDEVLGKKIARKEAKIRKEYDKKYSALEEVLKAGTGKETVEEITDTFTDFYKKKGIEVRNTPKYNARDEEVLAKAEAEEIISYGYDEVVEEVERLAKLGVANMTPRDKAVFKVLAEHRQNAERSKELSGLGVTEAEIKEFSEFAGKFNANTPTKDIYDIYRKMKPKKDIKPMGSMTNKSSEEGTVKDFYTRDEALQFTKKDFDKNPALFEAVRKSMYKWK
jgi:hypothetical protein